MGVFEFLWRLRVLPFGSPPKLIETDVCSAAVAVGRRLHMNFQ